MNNSSVKQNSKLKKTQEREFSHVPAHDFDRFVESVEKKEISLLMCGDSASQTATLLTYLGTKDQYEALNQILLHEEMFINSQKCKQTGKNSHYQADSYLFKNVKCLATGTREKVDVYLKFGIRIDGFPHAIFTLHESTGGVIK